MVIHSSQTEIIKKDRNFIYFLEKEPNRKFWNQKVQ